jgi:hypothetical protein
VGYDHEIIANQLTYMMIYSKLLSQKKNWLDLMIILKRFKCLWHLPQQMSTKRSPRSPASPRSIASSNPRRLVDDIKLMYTIISDKLSCLQLSSRLHDMCCDLEDINRQLNPQAKAEEKPAASSRRHSRSAKSYNSDNDETLGGFIAPEGEVEAVDDDSDSDFERAPKKGKGKGGKGRKSSDSQGAKPAAKRHSGGKGNMSKSADSGQLSIKQFATADTDNGWLETVSSSSSSHQTSKPFSIPHRLNEEEAKFESANRPSSKLQSLDRRLTDFEESCKQSLFSPARNPRELGEESQDFESAQGTTSAEAQPKNESKRKKPRPINADLDEDNAQRTTRQRLSSAKQSPPSSSADVIDMTSDGHDDA